MEINPLASLDDVQPDDIDDGPIVVLNLLKFKTDESLDTYLEYLGQARVQCADSGIELIYGGELEELIQGDIGVWMHLFCQFHEPSIRIRDVLLRYLSSKKPSRRGGVRERGLMGFEADLPV